VSAPPPLRPLPHSTARGTMRPPPLSVQCKPPSAMYQVSIGTLPCGKYCTGKSD